MQSARALHPFRSAMTDLTPAIYFVIECVSHGSAAREDKLHGGPPHRRYLDVYGRWVAHGTEQIPILAWENLEGAQAACSTASSMRKGELAVSTLGGHDYLPGKQLKLFCPANTPALAGQLPRERVSNAKLAADWHRTKVFTRAVLALQETTSEESKQVAVTQWNRIIWQAFGGGSVVSASQFLSGKRAANILDLLKSGSLIEDEELPIEDIERAIVIARSDHWNQPT